MLLGLFLIKKTVFLIRIITFLTIKKIYLHMLFLKLDYFFILYILHGVKHHKGDRHITPPYLANLGMS